MNWGDTQTKNAKVTIGVRGELLLIIAENIADENKDELVDDPDDASQGGTLRLDFSTLGTATIHAITFVDLDDPDPAQKVELFQGGVTGTLLATVPLPVTGNNGVSVVPLDVPGVDTVVITLTDSAAIDNITFTPESKSQPERGFSFEDFRSPAPSLITTNGDAEFRESVLRLTPDEGSRVGSAFFNAPFAFDAHTSFSSHFQFRIHGERAGTSEGGDGLVFIIQNDPRGVHALGTDGSGLGYSFGGSFGESPINKSVGIAFDTFPFQLSSQGNVELLQIAQDNSTSLAESLQTFNFASGNPLTAWIDYNGQTDLLEIYLSQTTSKPSSPLLTQTVAIDSVVGSQAFFGFSAATGARFNIHDIESWELSVKKDMDVEKGLISFYPFNGNANDESGNGNHGTVQGATLTEDRFGNADSAYSFDGIDDIINLGSPQIFDLCR